MEVVETAACGISQREFALELDDEELIDFYRILLFVQEDVPYYDEDYLEELNSQMSYIIGPSLQEMPEKDDSQKMDWEIEGNTYILNFDEDTAKSLNRILTAVEHPGEGFDKNLNQKLIEQIFEMEPSILENLPIINR